MSDMGGFPCKFRLGYSTVSGIATYADQEHRHDHVLRVRIDGDAFSSATRWVALCLSHFARRWVQTWLPGPFLPRSVIVKKLKPTWDEEFDDEKKAYQKLQPLQGHVVPVFYGEGTCDGTRAFVLSDIGGAPLYAEEFRYLSKSTIEAMLKPALKAVLSCGLEPADPQPTNYHIAGDAVFLLDFEDTVEVDPARVELLTESIAHNIARLTVYYHKHHYDCQ